MNTKSPTTKFYKNYPVTEAEFTKLAEATFKIYQYVGYDLPQNINLEEAVEVCLDSNRLTDHQPSIENGQELQDMFSNLYQMTDDVEQLYRDIARKAFYG